jgi:aspartate ammonia-lyase
VPISLSREWNAYALTLRKCAERIESVQNQELMEVGIGGSAAGTALNVPERYLEHVLPALKRLTGFDLRPARHLGEAMQSQAPLYAYASTLKLVCLELTRIANDLRLMASGPFTGLGEIRIPAAQPGSSMMPGKVNPSLLEMLHQVCFRVIGSADTVAWSVAAGQFELNVMMPIMAYANLESTLILTQALEAVRTRCIFGIEPRRRRLQSYFESTVQVATALTPILGYNRVAEAVKRSEQEGVPVLQWIESQGLLTAEEIRKQVNEERFKQTPKAQ